MIKNVGGINIKIDFIITNVVIFHGHIGVDERHAEFW